MLADDGRRDPSAVLYYSCSHCSSPSGRYFLRDLHLCLMIVGRREANLSKRPSASSASLAARLTRSLSIPIVAELIAGIWKIVLYCIGFAPRPRGPTLAAPSWQCSLPVILCCRRAIVPRNDAGTRCIWISSIINNETMQILRRPLAPGETNHELLWLTVSSGGLVLAATWLATEMTRLAGLFVSCADRSPLSDLRLRQDRPWHFFHAHFPRGVPMEPARLPFLLCVVDLQPLFAGP